MISVTTIIMIIFVVTIPHPSHLASVSSSWTLMHSRLAQLMSERLQLHEKQWPF